jgi:hypothetical protein
MRDYVDRLYGAYWYNRSLEEGRETYRRVREQLPDRIPMILKLGCTEYERKCGPSDQWKVDGFQKAAEELIEQWIDFNPWQAYDQSIPVIHDIHWRWIRWACASGDQTYLELTEGQRLYPPPVTYHEDDTTSKPTETV